jgi:hypothetical protein
MKKSIFAMFLMMFTLLAAPVVYAEDMADEATAATDEPLPPLVDEAIANDTAQ